MLIYFFVLSFRLLLQHVSLFWGLDQNNTNNEGKEKKKKKERKKLSANVLKQDQNKNMRKFSVLSPFLKQRADR